MNSILIADDDEFYRTQIGNFLRSAGYIVKIVKNGQEAIKELQRQNYDVFILDIDMEGLSGLGALPIVKSISSSLPIIVATGDDSLELERVIRSYGVFYYLVKPFEMDEIKEVIESAVNKGKKDSRLKVKSRPTFERGGG